MNYKIGLIAICAIASLTSCQNSSHLLLYQQANLGLNAAINPSTQNLHVRIGLRREFGAIVPKYEMEPNPDTPGIPDPHEKKAASAYFGSRARITSPWRVPEVAEVMATGDAAIAAAQAGNALNFTTP